MLMRARSILGLSSGLLAGALGRQVSFAEGGGGGARPPPSPPSPSRPAVRLQTQDTMVDLSSERRRPVVICGPSGVGKGTLIARLQAEFPDEFGFSVSHTTRAPRPGEADGVHYHFCSKEAMEAAIGRGARFIRSPPPIQRHPLTAHIHHRAGEFIEHARVHANIYGTSAAAVRAVAAAGKCCLLDIDVQVLHEVSIHAPQFFSSHRAIPLPSQGAELVKKSDLNARFVFVAPPSYEELEKRLRGRGTETEEKLQVRLKNARGEMEYMDRPGFFDAVIVNADLDRAYSELKFALLLGPPPPPK